MGGRSGGGAAGGMGSRSLGGNFDAQERHMKLNGYDCELEDIYEA